MIYIGCCGFSVSIKKYFQTFRLVEIQRTFYQLPQMQTVTSWRNQAPEGFQFTLKAWQGITHLASSPTYRKARINLPEESKKNLGHFQFTPEVQNTWEKSLKIALELKAPIIVLQCPPSFKETPENWQNLQKFFSWAPRKNVSIAIEFRSEWQAETIYSLCKEFDLIHCVDPFKQNAIYGTVRYYRLHGSPPGEKLYRYKYQPNDFAFLANKIREDLSSNRKVYCLFNNLSMWEDALAFREFLTKLEWTHDVIVQ